MTSGPNAQLSEATAVIATRPNSADELRSASFLKSLSGLPGVVIYQRVVTPDEQIRYTYISEGCIDIFGVTPE